MGGLELLIPFVMLGVLALIFIIPILAIVKAYNTGKQVESLREEIQRLQAALWRAGIPEREKPAEPEQPNVDVSIIHRLAEAQAPPPAPPEVETIPPVEEEEAEELESVPPAPPPPPTPQFSDWRMSTPPDEPTAPRQPAGNRLSVAEWEMLIGGNIVNRIAAIGMIIVAAFFLKYAYDHHWITPPLVVVIGFAAGFVLLFAGSRFHRANAQIFAHGLIGAGISILYLSGYATFRYELVSQPIALAIMSVVTIIAVAQAIRYDSFVVCLLGLLGGFLTPLLLGGGTGGGEVNHFGLFAYIALLDAGLLLVGLKRDSWAIIDLLVLAGTYITYLVWFDQFFKPSLVITAIPFVTVVWALYCTVDFCRIAKWISTYRELRAFVGICSSGLFYIAMYVLLGRRFTDPGEFKHWMALVSLMIGAVYFLGLLALIRSGTDDRSFIPRYVLTAIALLAIATGLGYTGFLQVSLWAVEALALIWCGLRWRIPSAYGAGLALFTVALVGLVGNGDTFAYRHLKAFVPVWNPRLAAYATIAAALGLSAFLFRRSEAEERESINSVLQTACCTVLLVLFAVETNDLFRQLIAAHTTRFALLDYTRYMAIGAVWAIYSLVLIGLGAWRKSRTLPHLGAGALLLATGLVVLNGFSTGSTRLFLPVLNPRVAGFALLCGMLIAGRYLLARCRGEWAIALHQVLRVMLALLVLQLLSVETYMLFSGHRYGAMLASALKWNALSLPYLMMGVAWVLYSVPVVWLGLDRRDSVLIVIGLGTLAAGVLTVAVQGAAYSPLLQFALIANVRFAAFAIALLALILHHWTLAKHRECYPWVRSLLIVVQIVASLLAFELVTSETRDFFGRMSADPREEVFRFSANMRQMTISVVWLVYSFLLVSIGFWRRSRTLRFVAIGLFGITILKVFISDLSFLEPLYRIFSFAGLAMILFATSYLYQRHRSLILGEEPAPEPLPDEVP